MLEICCKRNAPFSISWFHVGNHQSVHWILISPFPVRKWHYSQWLICHEWAIHYRYSTVPEKVMLSRKKHFKCKKQLSCGIFHLPVWKQHKLTVEWCCLDDLCTITSYGVHIPMLWVCWLQWSAHPNAQSPPHRNTIYTAQTPLEEPQLQVGNFSLPKESIWVPAQACEWQ